LGPKKHRLNKIKLYMHQIYIMWTELSRQWDGLRVCLVKVFLGEFCFLISIRRKGLMWYKIKIIYIKKWKKSFNFLKLTFLRKNCRSRQVVLLAIFLISIGRITSNNGTWNLYNSLLEQELSCLSSLFGRMNFLFEQWAFTYAEGLRFIIICYLNC
jgi:hypothetical protein